MLRCTACNKLSILHTVTSKLLYTTLTPCHWGCVRLSTKLSTRSESWGLNLKFGVSYVGSQQPRWPPEGCKAKWPILQKESAILAKLVIEVVEVMEARPLPQATSWPLLSRIGSNNCVSEASVRPPERLKNGKKLDPILLNKTLASGGHWGCWES